jgi:colanic acid biosynthesis glycosyl transferase WcaI
LAAGRPVLASVDADSEVQRVVDAAGAGVAVGPEDSAAFCSALVRLLDDREGREAMGRAGRVYIEKTASAAGVAATYLDLFARLRSARRRR